MMLNEQEINWVKWLDGVSLPDFELIKNLEKYKIHELDLKACLKGNQRARVDKYENYNFIVFHAPKYNKTTKMYELNEFDIFLSKSFLLSFREHSFSKIDKIFDYFHEGNIESVWDIKMKELKQSTSYILYEIINLVFEKAFSIINDTKLDIKKLEKKVFDKGDNALVKDIMVKKRNIVILKHIFRSQVVVLRQLKDIVPNLYDDNIILYFDELEDKLNQIISEIDILWESIDSIEDAFKSMIDIKTNFTVKVLTTFSSFMLPLTLITSFYGMNVTPLPYVTHPFIIYLFLAVSPLVMLVIYFILKMKGKF